MEQTESTVLVYTAEIGPVIDQHKIIKPDVQCFAFPSFQELLDGVAKPFSYQRLSWEEAKNNPIVVLHSSGSTGAPKPVTMTHGSFSVLDNERNLPGVSGRRKRDFSIWNFPGGGRFYHIFPYFHLAGFLSNVVNPVFTEASSPVIGPPLKLPSGSLLKDIMRSQPLRALYIPPMIAEQLLQEKDNIALFKQLDFICYTGAPFSPAAGKMLTEVTELVSLYGSTEAFQVPQLVPSGEDWAYMEWNPNFNVQMQRCDDEEGAYELVLHTGPETETTSALNHNYPGVAEWRTKDLFKRHPTKDNLWRYFGRRDDIIVLSNGEKFNPVPLELYLQGHPLLAGALAVGQGRPRTTLLLEPKVPVSEDERLSFVGKLWDSIEKANNLVPGHGRISRSNVIVADKPFSRAGKGTIVRKLTEKAYESEINSIYTEEASASKIIVLPRADSDAQAVSIFVRSVVVASFPTAASIADDEDLFSHGLDSLKTVEIVATFKASIGREPGFSNLSWISPAMLYNHATIQQLASVIGCFLRTKIVPQERSAEDRHKFMEELVDHYTKDLPEAHVPYHLDDSSGITIVLTGSTGSLGTCILASLLKTDKVKRIICLTRDPEARSRQARSLKSQGVPQFDESRVMFFTINLGEPNLGMSADDQALLLEDADVIIHNAWRVDFNLSARSFANTYIRSVRSLIDLSARSRKSARICFVSSVSSIMGTATSVPEEAPQKLSSPLRLGYAESKCVAEMILERASSISQTPVTILRVGQVAGSTDQQAPAWPTQEWLYPIIKASQKLNLIPIGLLPINWVPINLASRAIAELAVLPSQRSMEVYNIVNPSEVPWTTLVDELKFRFGPESQTAELSEWIEAASRSVACNADDPLLRPALALMREMARMPPRISFSTERAVAASHTMALLEPINKDLLGFWLEQWNVRKGPCNGLSP